MLFLRFEPGKQFNLACILKRYYEKAITKCLTI
jgi:hypothetical protein